MNALFFQMSSTRKTHNQKMTKTLETNITSEKGEEKSPNITNYLILSNNNTISKIFYEKISYKIQRIA